LASASPSRSHLLERVGVPHLRDAADIDEDLLKRKAIGQQLSVEQAALVLATAKATVVGQRHPDKFVLGADQILECGSEWFDKPVDLPNARNHLKKLRGRRHRLVNGLAIVHQGSTVWTETAVATLEMREFSDSFLEDYLRRSGEKILNSVGAYLLEAEGAQLFRTIDGDYFTILGLPLLPVLNFLRQHNIIEA